MIFHISLKRGVLRNYSTPEKLKKKIGILTSLLPVLGIDLAPLNPTCISYIKFPNLQKPCLQEVSETFLFYYIP